MKKSIKKSKEVDVLVSITLSKRMKVKLHDIPITVDKDEDGITFEDYDVSDIDLKEVVETNYYLPDEVNAICSLPGVHIPPCVKEDFDGWNRDDYEVIID